MTIRPIFALTAAAGLALTAASLCTSSHAATAAEPAHGDTKPTAVQPVAAARTSTVKGALADVGDISLELKTIDKRLQSMEHSLAAMSDSLAPVGELARADGLRALMGEASDLAYARTRSLIFWLTGCGAGLILLFAALRHWSSHPGKA